MKVMVTGHRPERITGREQEIKEWLTKKVEELTAGLDFGNMDEEGLKGVFQKLKDNPNVKNILPNILSEFGIQLPFGSAPAETAE